MKLIRSKISEKKFMAKITCGGQKRSRTIRSSNSTTWFSIGRSLSIAKTWQLPMHLVGERFIFKWKWFEFWKKKKGVNMCLMAHILPFFKPWILFPVFLTVVYATMCRGFSSNLSLLKSSWFSVFTRSEAESSRKTNERESWLAFV